MASANFAASLTHVFRHEGGYVDHPLDPGGATNRGITRATLAAHRGAPVSKAEVMALDAAEAAAIYRTRYWDAINGDALPPGLDLAVFDAAVNCGPARAARWLQGCVGAKADGRIGPRTIAAVRGADARATIVAFGRVRLSFKSRLSTWRTFGRGWSRRVRDIEAAALVMAAAPKPFAARPAAPPPAAEYAAFRPQPPQEPPMDRTKTLLASRTLWANMIGLAAVIAGHLGYDAAAIDGPGLVEAGSHALAAASFIASSIFRVIATRRLSP